MHKPSFSYRPKLIMLSLIGTSLLGCSAQPVRPPANPQVVQCMKPKVDSQLLLSPKVGEINRLLGTLGMPLVNVGTPSTP